MWSFKGPLLLPISEGLAGGQGRDEGPMLSALPSSYTSPATKMNEAKGAPPPGSLPSPFENLMSLLLASYERLSVSR